MSDQRPSKELVELLRKWHSLKGESCFREAADEIDRLRNVLHDYQCAHANLLLKVRDCPNCDAGAVHEPTPEQSATKLHEVWCGWRTTSRCNCGAHPSASSEPPTALESTLQKIMARLADMLSDDNFNNIEALVLEAGVRYPDECSVSPPDVLRDAERYRWLRNFANFSHVDDLLNRVDVTSLDQAIDVARASVTKSEGRT